MQIPIQHGWTHDGRPGITTAAQRPPVAVATHPSRTPTQHGPGGGVTATNPTPKPPVLSQTQQSVYDLLNATLNSWGLGSLSSDLKNLILQGDTAPDTLALALSQTKAYKQRFAGNELRKAQGLPELTPAQYIAMEEGYSQVLRAYGLPRGFYDSHEDFTKLIGGDVSVQELQSRAQIAHDEYTSAPQATKDLWSTYFGKGDILAGLLDPQVATQVIQDRATQVAIGGEAAKNGFQVNQGRAQQFQQAGVTLAGAQKAYQQIGQVFGTDQNIASRFGEQFGQAQEENDLLLGQAGAANERQRLYDSEQGLFHGKGAFDAAGLSANPNYT